MLRNVHPQDVSIDPFKTYKRFQFTNVDSGSGVYGLRGVSGSYHNFITGSAASQSFGVYNSLSESLNKEPYSLGTYYSLPLYYTINNLYYERFSNNPKLPKSSGRTEPFLSFGATNPNKQYRILHNSCSVISIQQDLIGEEIKPKSVQVTDNSTDVTFTIKDDGDGNLYDNAYSSSYAAFKSGSFKYPELSWTTAGSGSVVGNVFYKTGMLVFTDTGSYKNVALGTGTDGFEVDYRSTHTIYQHEYTVIAPAGQFNRTRNISATYQRSGSVTVVEGAKPHYYFPPGDNPGLTGSGSFESSYQATQFAENFTTHSQFAPYMTTIGLYNDNNELLVVGRTSKPIKNDDTMDMSFVLRFDV
jgi:hypothetical protein|tara:strand:- start:117 stop:1190 length:1074 start_codon:yes stop_codon:yes gene_type:complete